MYEIVYTYDNLLNDIIQYDTQIVSNAIYDMKNIDKYTNIFIEIEDINKGVMFSKWNIFDWSETKYINEQNRNIILSNLNYWRQTGNLPRNINTKSI
jgi:hypothetical protein